MFCIDTQQRKVYWGRGTHSAINSPRYISNKGGTSTSFLCCCSASSVVIFHFTFTYRTQPQHAENVFILPHSNTFALSWNDISVLFFFFSLLPSKDKQTHELAVRDATAAKRCFLFCTKCCDVFICFLWIFGWWGIKNREAVRVWCPHTFHGIWSHVDSFGSVSSHLTSAHTSSDRIFLPCSGCTNTLTPLHRWITTCFAQSKNYPCVTYAESARRPK